MPGDAGDMPRMLFFDALRVLCVDIYLIYHALWGGMCWGCRYVTGMWG